MAGRNVRPRRPTSRRRRRRGHPPSSATTASLPIDAGGHLHGTRAVPPDRGQRLWRREPEPAARYATKAAPRHSPRPSALPFVRPRSPSTAASAPVAPSSTGRSTDPCTSPARLPSNEPAASVPASALIQPGAPSVRAAPPRLRPHPAAAASHIAPASAAEDRIAHELYRPPGSPWKAPGRIDTTGGLLSENGPPSTPPPCFSGPYRPCRGQCHALRGPVNGVDGGGGPRAARRSPRRPRATELQLGRAAVLGFASRSFTS